MEKKISYIDSKGLAMALCFMGFKYDKFTGQSGKQVFRFEETPKYLDALHELMEMRKKYRD